MNHLPEWTMDDAGDLTRVKCSCGWSRDGEYWVLRSAFDKHVEDHTPAWRDRPSVPGWWVSWTVPHMEQPYQSLHRVTQDEIDEGRQFVGPVYGPIPEPEETP